MTHLNTTNLGKAIKAHHNGGWLLNLGDSYLVTDDEHTVRDLRGQVFIDRCEQIQVWDETSHYDIVEELVEYARFIDTVPGNTIGNPWTYETFAESVQCHGTHRGATEDDYRAAFAIVTKP